MNWSSRFPLALTWAFLLGYFVMSAALLAHVGHCLKSRGRTMRNDDSTIPSSAETPWDVTRPPVATRHADASNIPRHFQHG